MASIGGFLSGGLNLLDLPGSMARDLFAGENPLDQLRDPFGETGRQMRSGRDLARRWGWAGPQNTWGNLLGGMALEVATDPITWASGGLLGAAKLIGPASKAGKAAMIASKAVDPLGTAVGAGIGQLAKRAPRYPTLQAMAHADLPPVELGKPWLRKEILAKSAKEPVARIGYTPGTATSQETVPRIGHTPYAPPFYSRLERAVEKLSDKPIKANPQRVLKSLKAAAGREGFAEKEVEYRRLMDALEGKQTVTKADLQKQLTRKPLSLTLKRFREDAPMMYEVHVYGEPSPRRTFSTRGEAAEYARGLNARLGLEAGDAGVYRAHATPRSPEFTMPGGRNLTEDLLVHPPEQAGYTYRSGHYSDVPNWVTEVVTKDYDLPGGGVGKVAQEIQSDEMQKLAKRQSLTKSLADAEKTMAALGPRMDELSIAREIAKRSGNLQQAAELDRQWEALMPDYSAARARHYRSAGELEEFPPPSPFESEWENLGIKDLIRQTAESPTATQFGWLTGEDMARWAAGAGEVPSERVLKGLQQHADVVLPQKAQKIAGLPMERGEILTETPLHQSIEPDDILTPTSQSDIMDRIATDVGNLVYSPRDMRLQLIRERADSLGLSVEDLSRLVESAMASDNPWNALFQSLTSKPVRRPAHVRRMTPELRHRALYEGFPYMALAGAAPLGAAAMYAALEGRGQPSYQESF